MAMDKNKGKSTSKSQGQRVTSRTTVAGNVGKAAKGARGSSTNLYSSKGNMPQVQDNMRPAKKAASKKK